MLFYHFTHLLSKINLQGHLFPTSRSAETNVFFFFSFFNALFQRQFKLSNLNLN